MLCKISTGLLDVRLTFDHNQGVVFNQISGGYI
jgi:hypothetical protein